MRHIRPEPGTFPPYYENYYRHIPAGADPLEMLAVQPTALHQLLAGMSEEQAAFRYAPGKWSIKQVVLHIADSERIFAYRALRFARGDAQELHGFDENTYADASGADNRTLTDLLAEYAAVRQASLALFRGFQAEQFDLQGRANQNPASVRALLYVLAGHEAHHLHVLAERYLPLLKAEA
ncbi:DinB family protein [Hymenobacter koreensis]|uniref:DinB family protein n=1 Tax=Hymenobacter koreensis TaxID=1084523 RepID=A0ABP8J5H4_9BACT